MNASAIFDFAISIAVIASLCYQGYLLTLIQKREAELLALRELTKSLASLVRLTTGEGKAQNEVNRQVHELLKNLDARSKSISKLYEVIYRRVEILEKNGHANFHQ